MLYIIFYAPVILSGEIDSDGFDDLLLTVVSVHVNVIIIRVVVVVIVLVFFVPSVNVLPEQVSNLFIRGRECIVPVILFLVVLILSAVLILQLGNKRVCVDIFV